MYIGTFLMLFPAQGLSSVLQCIVMHNVVGMSIEVIYCNLTN